MMDTDRTALFCDLAETYHVFGFDSLPLEQIAMLAVGLADDSRIKQKLSGVEYPPNKLIWTMISDNLTLIRHMMNGKKGDSPYLFMENIDIEPKETIPGFDSGKDFTEAWSKIMEG